MHHTSSKHRGLRVFCSTFMLTLCLLVLGSGFLIVDYNSRQTAFGESGVRGRYRVQDDWIVSGSEAEAARNKELRVWSGRAWLLLPARLRLFLLANEAEGAAAQAAYAYAREWAGGDT